MLHVIIHRRRELIEATRNKYAWLVQAVFFLTVLATIHTDDLPRAFSFWERQLPIFLFPLILFAEHEVIFRMKRKLLELSSILSVLVIAFLYIDALRTISYYNLPLDVLFSHRFINHNFSLPLDIHASYLSLIVAIGLLAFIANFNRQQVLSRKLVIMIMICFLLAGLIQLGSRAVLIGMLLVMNLAIPFYFFKTNRVKLILGSVIVTTGLLFQLFRMDGFRERFVSDLQADVFNSMPLSEQLADTRKERWTVAIDLVKESPLVGYGTGMETGILKEAYFENKFYHSYLHRLNAHNQYLSFLLKGGILALLAYLFILGKGMYYAIRSKDLVFTGFMILIITMSFGENLLDVNKGIVFYAFFFSWFLAACQKPKFIKDKEGQPAKQQYRFNKMTSTQPVEY